jgi:hypothetical protein
MSDAFMLVHRAPIILLAARNKVPAVYYQSIWAETAVRFPTDPIGWTSFTARRPMSIASSRAKSRRSFPFNCRPNLRCF